MPATLFTFLGGAGRRSNGSYSTTRYRFADGFEHEASYFPVALLEWMRARRPDDMPDRLVVMGTASSKWDDVSLSFAGAAEGEGLALAEKLSEAAEAERVDDAALRPLADLVTATLGIETVLTVIPFCTTADEAADLVAMMANLTRRKERLYFDITHSFRHLPMLSLLSGLVSETLKGATVAGVYYGALDRYRSGDAPVMQLEGILAATRWIRALAAYEASGDVGCFAPPVSSEVGAAAAEDLERAAFAEKTMHFEAAAAPIARALAAVARAQGTMTPLFLPAMRDALAWAGEADPVRRRLALARQRLAAGDFPRAAIIAFEAAVLALWERVGDGDVADEERQAMLLPRLRAAGAALRAEREAFLALKDMRNAFAHARRPHHDRARRAMTSPKALQSFFTETLATLFRLPRDGARTPARPGRTLLVTGHDGAVEWAGRRGIAAERIAHLDVGVIGPGDTVIGTLPAHLVADVCARGGRYFHLAIDLDADARRRNLTADEMEARDARLVEIAATALGSA